MGTGYLVVQARTGDDSLPVRNAHVTLFDGGHNALYETYTDANGNTESLTLPAPDIEYTLDPTFMRPAYSVWDVDVEAAGFVTLHIHRVEIVDTQTSILPTKLIPLSDEPNPVTDIDVDIPPMSINETERNLQSVPPPDLTSGSGALNVLGASSVPRTPVPRASANAPDPAAAAAAPRTFSAPPAPAATAPRAAVSGFTLRDVIIPDYITVHLGAPTNASARNVRVKFTDYIKNVASVDVCQGVFSRRHLGTGKTAASLSALRRFSK